MSLRARVQRAVDAVGSVSTWRLVSPLTAAYVLAYLVATVLASLQMPLIQAGLVVAAGTALLWPRLARAPWAWWAMAALMGLALVSSWMLVDNHVFLATYWLIAVATTRSAPEAPYGRRREQGSRPGGASPIVAIGAEAPRPRALALAASSLVGLTMFFATLHKLRTPEYLSGDFFHLTFLTEARFAPLGWVLGEDLGQLSLANAERLAALKADPTQGPIVLSTGSAALRKFALTLSWLVVGFELLLAVLWLVRFDGVHGRRARHGALLLFLASTYTLAPVPGFGSILAILGLADTREGEGGLRAAYLILLVHVLFGAALLRTVLD